MIEFPIMQAERDISDDALAFGTFRFRPKRGRRGVLMRYTSLYQWAWLVLGIGGTVCVGSALSSLFTATGHQGFDWVEMLLMLLLLFVTATPLVIGLKIWRDLQPTYREVYLDHESHRVEARGLHWFRVVTLGAAPCGDVRFEVVPAKCQAGPKMAPRAALHGFAVLAHIGAVAVPMAFVAVESEAAGIREAFAAELS